MPSSDAMVILGHAPVAPWPMSWVTRNINPTNTTIPAAMTNLSAPSTNLAQQGKNFNRSGTVWWIRQGAVGWVEPLRNPSSFGATKLNLDDQLPAKLHPRRDLFLHRQSGQPPIAPADRA